MDFSLQTQFYETKEELINFLNSMAYKQRYMSEMEICSENKDKESWIYEGYCECCNEKSSFLVDWQYSNRITINFRERLICLTCELNSRQRFMFGHLKKLVKRNEGHLIYLYEQVTPLYKHTQKFFGDEHVIGSEYLGINKKSGEIEEGIRHEDALNLSFKNNTIDIIVSNDVYEHVPDIQKCMNEAYRVLKPGGTLLFTIPFYYDSQVTKKRADFLKGELIYYELPQYHGNPISDKGSLVFYDYGWDIFDILEQSGFKKDSSIMMYYSSIYGYLGLQTIFSATK